MRWRILGVIGAVYTAQFIPLFFAIMALPVILRIEGHSATTIGLVQLAALPYIFKFLWAPVIDRFQLGKTRYKTWIVTLSSLHLISIVVLSMMDPSGNLTPVFVALIFASLTVSTQDVAVDSLVISLLHPSERSMAATLQNFGAYTGAVIGGFGFLYIYDHIGWTVALLIQGALFAAPLLALHLVQEPPRAPGAPPVNLRMALGFFGQARIKPWLAILATMRLPLVMTMLPMRLMMVDQGMGTEEIALWFGLFAMSAGGGAAALFGPLLRHVPRIRALYLIALLNIPVLLGVVYLATSFPDLMRYSIVLVWGVIAVGDIVIYSGAMDKVRPEMPGFDFSAQVAIYSMMPMMADPLIGLVIDNYGFAPAYYLTVPVSVLPLAVLWFFVARPGKAAQSLEHQWAQHTAASHPPAHSIQEHNLCPAPR